MSDFVYTLPPFEVKATRYSQNPLKMHVERRPDTLRYNEGTGNFDVEPGETVVTLEAFEVKATPIAPGDSGNPVVDFVLSNEYTVGGRLFIDAHYTFADSSTYVVTLRVGPNGEFYNQAGTKASFDNSTTWLPHSGPVPDTVHVPGGGPGGQNEV